MKKILLCLALIGLALPAQAAIQQVRIVAVGVDASASKAEAYALDYARKRAVYLTGRKISPRPEEVQAVVESFREEDFREIVRGSTINRIKRKGDRTYADVTVTIVDTALRRALKLPERSQAEEEADEVPMRGVLVLPIYVKNDRPYLWEKENELREPLRAEVLRQAHGAVLVPAGDLEDLRLIDYANALSVTGAELKPMFERYGADEVVVAIYTPTKDETPPGILLRRLTPDSNRTEKVTMELANKPTSEQQTLQAASLIASALTQIASATSDAEQARLAKATQIPIMFQYANPRELASMQESLRNQSEVLMLKLPSISLGEITGTAYVEGSPEKLREKLSKTGMIVTESGKGWKLSLR